MGEEDLGKRRGDSQWLLDLFATGVRYTTLCSSCHHTLWHHTGLREPGCTYLGQCRCCLFQRKAH